MVRSCIVCRSDYNKGDGFYQLPKNLETRQKWISACNISDFFAKHPEKKVWICFRHFGSESFTTKGLRLILKEGKLYSFQR